MIVTGIIRLYNYQIISTWGAMGGNISPVAVWVAWVCASHVPTNVCCVLVALKVIKLTMVFKDMGGSREWGGQEVWNSLENHKLLYDSLEILVRATLQKQLDPRVQLLLERGPYDPL